MKKTVLQILAITLLTYSTVYGISLISKPYTFTDGTKAEAGKVNADFDTAYTGINAAIGAINTAAGTKSSLDARLDYALNEDGTFKNISGVTASTQWTNPAFAFQYSSSTKFLVAGNQTDIYLPYRRVKANLAGGAAYSEVSASSYNSGNSKTHITLADAILTDPITSIEHSIVTPITSNNSAISSRMATGYIPASTNTASTLVLRDASGNFSAGAITANLTGNVTGNLTGNVTGNLTGNVTGNLTGNVTGTATNVDGTQRIPFSAKTAFHGALVRNSASLTIINNTATALTFDTEDYDTDSIHSVSLNTSRLVVPAGVSKVRLSARVLWLLSPTPDGQIQISLQKNGANTFAGRDTDLYLFPGAGSGKYFYQRLQTPLLVVNPGDYFEVVATQVTGGDGIVISFSTWFAMELVE